MPQQAVDFIVGQLVANRCQHRDRAKGDIVYALNVYKFLNPKAQIFTFNNGQQKELVCLDGTIPVHFKGIMYNIPVCIFLPDTYPYASPMCFVKPTSDMEIKVSRHVDASGRVYLPYLHEWKHNSADLLGLIQVMVIVFGELPPVFARPRNAATGPNANNMPYPSQQSGNLPYPSYPSSTGPTSYPSSNFNQYPGYPPTSAGTQQGYYPGGGQAYPNYPAATAGSLPYPNYPQHQQQHHSLPGTPSPLSSSHTPNLQTNSAFNMGTISDEHMRISLLSAVEDKLKTKLKEVLSQLQAEMEVLKNTEEELNTGKTTLDSILIKADQEQIELENSIQVLTGKNQEMSELLSKLEEQNNLDIDNTIDTTTPLYRQLLNAFAEENATEDAIYYTSEGLRKGVIDLDVFLKNIRQLSRKQFELRALMQKCRLKAGLPY